MKTDSANNKPGSPALPTERYDESAVPEYVLPSLFATEGVPETVACWETRRARLVAAFAEHVYGPVPAALPLEVEMLESDHCFGNTAQREQIRLKFARGGVEASLDLLIYRPLTDQPVATFLGLNFAGNQTVIDDPAVLPARSWVNPKYLTTDNASGHAARGLSSSRWPLAELLKRGFAVATWFYGDAAPDCPERWRDGFSRLWAPDGEGLPHWGEAAAISLWAWGNQRAMDYLLTRATVFDADRVLVIGHSRQGKTALWTGATDQRFAAAISNCSGCGGAALSRRCFGERIEHINANYPHWFTRRHKDYNGRESELPVDQHQLIATLAPRAVYVASASEDLHADPYGEFLATQAAVAAWQVYGVSTHRLEQRPSTGESIGDMVRYHCRSGKHNITAEDWRHYADFAAALPTSLSIDKETSG